MTDQVTEPGTPVTGTMAGTSILIAGATGGLGSAIAYNLLARGATLTLASRDPDRLAALGVEGHKVAVDFRDPLSSELAVRAAVDHGGGLDVVVNAVGVVAFGPVSDLSVDALEELFLTNTFVPVFLARAAIGELSEGGTIVNISGVIAEQNLPGMAAYGASKAATRSFGQALAREARRRKLRVIDARPPHTETGLVSRAVEGVAPRMPTGLDPALVAAVICDAIEGDSVTDLPSSAFVA